jgi:uncharacterized protein (TIGR02594 family)
MFSRRAIIGSGTIAAGLIAMKPTVGAQVASPGPERPPAAPLNPFNFQRPEDDPTFGSLISGGPPSAATVGNGPSRHDEVRTAFRLLFNAPRGVNHLAVAQYFHDLTDKVDATHKYNEEWVDRANPMIVGFFSMTNTAPSNGDQTSWCAAFVSFCLYTAGKQNKFSALSGAYRSYSASTDSPTPGDIVVFREAGPNGAKGFGHVGFFLSKTASTVKVLGGNQRGHTGSTGAVTTSDFPINGGGLQLHSFRKVV